MSATKFRLEIDLERIAVDMANRGWCARDLAAKPGLTEPTVSRFFSGQHQTMRTLKRIAAALGFSHRRYVLGVSREAA